MSGRRGTKKGGANSKYNKNAAAAAAAKKLPVDQQPPNHQQENFPEHRIFLARSLRRNDEDTAALVDLNRSLQRVKDNLMDVCGEEVLLDLGEGLFQLTPCERDLMVAVAPESSSTTADATAVAATSVVAAEGNHKGAAKRVTLKQRLLQTTKTALEDRLLTVDDASKLLCVDFLLRMKLRRRLLNRLARRLMRVAHAMDGEDVSAPVPPKYGDLRLHLDPEDLVAAQRHWQLQVDARERIAEFRQAHPDSLLPLIGVAGATITNNLVGEKGGEEKEAAVKEEYEEETRGQEGDTPDAATVSPVEAIVTEKKDDNGKEASKEGDNTVTKDENKDIVEDEDKGKDQEVSTKGGEDVAMKDENKDISKENDKAKDTTESTTKDTAIEDVSKEEDKAKDSPEAAKEDTDVAMKDEILETTSEEENKAKDITETAPPKVDGDSKEEKDVEMEDTDTTTDETAPKVPEESTTPREGEESAKSSTVNKSNGKSATEPKSFVENETTETKTADATTGKSETGKEEPSKETASADPEQSTPSTSPSKVSADAAEALLAFMSSPVNSPTATTPTTAAGTGGDEGVQDKITSVPVLPAVAEKVSEAAKESDDKMEITTGEEPTKAEEEEAKDVVVGDAAKKEATAGEEPAKPEEKAKDTVVKGAVKKEQSEKDAEAKSEEKEEDKSAATAADKEEEAEDIIVEEDSTPAESETIDADKKEESTKVTEEDKSAAADNKEGKMDVDNADEAKTQPEIKSDGDRKEGDTADPKEDEATASSPTVTAVKSEGEVLADKDKEDESMEVEDGTKAGEEAGGSTPKPEVSASSPMKIKLAAAEALSPSTTTSPGKKLSTPSKKPLIELPPLRDLSQLEKDYEILKDFVDAYEKEVDPTTGEVSFRALNEEEDREEDYVAINRGVGIGATIQKMSLKEKEMEFQRWQSAVLGKIPEAPTLDEIGMKNCVFLGGERRKRLRLQKEEEEREAKRRRMLDDSEESEDEEEIVKPKRNIGAVERKSPSKKSKEEKEELDARVTKRMKPLPLVPYPSFYESDLRRVRQVHFDLMSHSIRVAAQNRVQTCTQEYNTALKNSTSYFERKHKLDTQLGQLAVHYRNQMTNIKQEHGAKVQHESRRWKQKKAEYDANRLKKLMPTSWNTTPTGTHFTKAVTAKYREGSIPHTVGTCVADIVDAIDIKLSNNIRDEPFTPFSPSPQPTFETYVVDQNSGETMAQHAHRVQRGHQQELQTIQLKLNAAEEQRKGAWKKLMKVKAELESLNAPYGGKSAGSGGQPAVSHSKEPSYTPRARTSRGIEGYAPSGGVNTNDSKYSAARVKERIGDDGTVEPITRKVGADGLFQKPAGRSRKGMDWDAVRGVWVPTA